MAVLELLQYPDPRLKQVSAPVTVFDAALQSFLADLEATMRAGPGSVGIAAPQVNHFLRIAIVDVSSRPGIPQHGCLRLINPEIVQRAGEVTAVVLDKTGTLTEGRTTASGRSDERRVGDERREVCRARWAPIQ